MDGSIKITVLRKSHNSAFLDQFAEFRWESCERLQEGEEFISEGVNMPPGFCSWAWADIQKYVMVLARGGNFIGVQPGVYVTCCTDGFRPVFFKLERVQASG